MVKINIIKGRHKGLPLQYWLLVIFAMLFTLPVYALSLKDAQRDYLSGNYEEAIAKGRRLRENDENLYFLSLVYIKAGDYEKARASLEKLINHFSRSDFYDLARMKLADTYFLERDYHNARKLYENIESECPKLKNRSLLFLRRIQIASRRGEWDEKNKYIQLMKAEFPHSPEMKFVETIESYGDFFTIQVGAFSQKENSLALKNELSTEQNVYIVEEVSGAYPVYKVRVGKFKQRYDAEKTAKALREKGYPASIYP